MKSLAALSFAMIAFFSASVLAQEEGPPNFIVFLTDDQGWGDLGCYGHPVIQSPNLDRFASEGIRLTQCYAACSVCSPSRSAILTGRTPYRNGVWRWIPSGSQYHLRASEITVASLLKKQGYQTCHAGKWHLNGKFNSDEQPQPDDHGYDHWLATQNNASPNHLNPENFVRNGQQVGRVEGPSSIIAASEAIQWLESREDKSTPFFITVWTHEPHLPIESAPEFMAPYADLEDEGLRQHHGNITQMDAAFGKLMSAVDAMGYRDNTVVFFTSDNGPEGNGTTGRTRGSTGGLRGRKRHTHEGGIRVPGIIRWPGKIKAGATSATPAIGSDIFTTICDIAGIPIPDDRTIDGASLRPLFDGKPVERDQPLYWRNHLAPPQFRVGLRIGDWKIVASEDLESFELYNIHEDPQETQELSDVHPQKFEELKRRLVEHDASVLKEGPDWWKDEASRPRSRSRTVEPSAGKDPSGTFEVVLGTDVRKTDFGFRLEPEQEGLAFLKLPEPIVGQATVRLKYRNVSQGQATMNGALLIAEEPSNASSVKVGTAIGLGQHVAFRGGWNQLGSLLQKKAKFDAAGTFELVLRFDMERHSAAVTINETNMTLKLPSEFKSIQYLGLYNKDTATEFTLPVVETNSR